MPNGSEPGMDARRAGETEAILGPEGRTPAGSKPDCPGTHVGGLVPRPKGTNGAAPAGGENGKSHAAATLRKADPAACPGPYPGGNGRSLPELRVGLRLLSDEHGEGASRPTEALVVGDTVSHYKILGAIGDGGMGVVYKAIDTRLHRTVALKFLRFDAATGEESKDRLLREAKAAAALDHPNICTIHEIDEADGQTFLAMAYVEGESLTEMVERRPLPLDQALDIAIQIAEGLRAAHRKGIVHRDIKSSNVMIDGDGRVKIVDFGVACQDSGRRITKKGTIVGTPAYMSPEQVRAEDVDHRTDIWSLGTVIYEMLTGQLPFGCGSPVSVALAVQQEEPEPVTAQRAGVPLRLDWIVRKALAKNPDERYQHVEEMLIDLCCVRRQMETGAAYSRLSTSTRQAGNVDSAPDFLRSSRSQGFQTPPSRPYWYAAAIFILLLLAYFGLSRRLPVVVLMDTSAPEGVYDTDTRNSRGTNADDLNDVLRDLPIVLQKETVGTNWDRENQIASQNPELMLIQHSCFDYSMNPERSRAVSSQALSLEQFLGYVGVGSPRTEILVYSRGWAGDADARAWVDETLARFPSLDGRLFAMAVPDRGAATSFRNLELAEAVREQVRSILGL